MFRRLLFFSVTHNAYKLYGEGHHTDMPQVQKKQLISSRARPPDSSQCCSNGHILHSSTLNASETIASFRFPSRTGCACWYGRASFEYFATSAARIKRSARRASSGICNPLYHSCFHCHRVYLSECLERDRLWFRNIAQCGTTADDMCSRTRKGPTSLYRRSSDFVIVVVHVRKVLALFGAKVRAFGSQDPPPTFSRRSERPPSLTDEPIAFALHPSSPF